MVEKQKKYGDWKVQFFVDDFGAETNVGYITYSIIYGTFSNSENENSNSLVKFIYDADDILCFKLQKQGDHVVHPASYNDYRAKIKHSGGDVTKYSNQIYV